MKQRALHIALLTGLLAILSSCIVEKTPSPGAGGAAAELVFTARVPAAIRMESRGEVGTLPENAIADIHVLVFGAGDGRLVYKAAGRNLSVAGGSTNNNSVTFRATLPVGTQYDVMVLANAAGDLAGIQAGASKSDVLALVRQLSAGVKWEPTSAPIPMWDEQLITLSASSSPVFYLTRMLARVNVAYHPPQSESTPAFRLTAVRVYNYNTAGSLVADAAHNTTGQGAGHVAILPTLPPDPGTQLGSALVYDGSDISDGRACNNQIYLFEAAHRGSYADGGDWVDNPCLVVGGRYDSDDDDDFDDEPTSWYRIDLIGQTTDPQGAVERRWLSLLRNFSYNVSITSVSGPGYNDPGEALHSAPFNIQAGVLMWNDAQMENVVFDGRYMLAVSRNPFELTHVAHDAQGVENILRITVDHPDGWRATAWGDAACSLPVPDDAATGAPWLSITPGEASGPGNGIPQEMHLIASQNSSGAERTAWIRIESGRLEYIVRVVQSMPPGTISVDPSQRLLPATILPGQNYRITVTCLHADSTSDSEALWRLESPDGSWCRLAELSSTVFADASDSFEGRGTQTIYLIVTNNTDANPRATTITLNGAPAVQVIQRGNGHDMVVGGDHVPFDSDAKYYTYVGAFWRSDQTGERIVRIKAGADIGNTGRWVASVVWLGPHWGPDDGVVLERVTLAELQAANPNIYTANPGNAEDYPLTGITATSIAGTITTDTEEGKYITFRIGLKTPYVPSEEFPARYAIIRLAFGGSKYQRIFLRQGEGADYLLTSDDPVHSGGVDSPTRSAVKAFSPYNLTAANLNAKVPTPNPIASAFTDFPTQAGAFFQWASFYSPQQRVAWDPYSPLPQTIFWRADGTGRFWDSSAEALNETCPEGYRRPNDGPIDRNWPNNDISDSEVRMSLWYEPQTTQFKYIRTNSFWGYYADGHFDRYPIEKARDNDPIGMVVCKNNRNAAYAGHLFFNPFFDSSRHNASLFFPAAGNRDMFNGRLANAGREARYWSSSTEESSSLNGAYSWSYNFYSDGRISNINANRSNAYSIRCVKR